jgi:hypothetical protein
MADTLSLDDVNAALVAPPRLSVDDVNGMLGGAPAQPDRNGALVALASPEPSDQPVTPGSGIGRTKTAISELGRGATDVAAAVPEAYAIGASAESAKLAGELDKVDKGEPTSPIMPSLADAALVARYRGADAQGRAQIRQTMLAPADPRQSGAYQAGQKIQSAAQAALPVNPAYEQEYIAGKIPYALGSTAAFAAAAPLGPAGVALAGVASGAQQGFTDALDHGASIADALKTAKLDGLIGASEAVPIEHLLDRLDTATGGLVKRTLVNAMKQGTEEALQEAFQQISNNLVANGLVGYDKQRGTFSGAGENAGVGFTVGGLMAGLASLIVPGKQHTRGHVETATAAVPPLTPEDHASPIPDTLIQQGRETIAKASGEQTANSVLQKHDLPPVGQRVVVQTRDGETMRGQVTDAFGHDGIRVTLDNGAVLEESAATLRDAGVSVLPEPVETPEAVKGESPSKSEAKPFVPTSEWQDVPPGAVLPPGMQIQMDLATGHQQARIMPSSAAPEAVKGEPIPEPASRPEPAEVTPPVADAETGRGLVPGTEAYNRWAASVVGARGTAPEVTPPVANVTTLPVPVAKPPEPEPPAAPQQVTTLPVPVTTPLGYETPPSSAPIDTTFTDVTPPRQIAGPATIAPDSIPAAPLAIENLGKDSIGVRATTTEGYGQMVARIKDAVPGFKPLWNRTAEAWVFPARREPQVRAALSGLLGEQLEHKPPISVPEAAQAPAVGEKPEPAAQPAAAAQVPAGPTLQPAPEPAQQDQPRISEPGQPAPEPPVAADFYKDNPRPEELGKFLPSNWAIAKSKKQVETALRKGQNPISRKEYNAARDKAMAAREAKPEPAVEAPKPAEPEAKKPETKPTVIRAEDFGYKEPTKLGPPGPPRTVKITYASNLDTVDRARSQPSLTPAQRKAAEEASARTVEQFKAAEKQAREILKSSPEIPEHARALKEWGERLDKAADGGLSAFARKAERDQWRRGFEEGARNTEHQPRANRTRDDGYKAGAAWLASNPKPSSNVPTITVEARTASGQKTTFELPADPEQIAGVRERFEKLPPQAKYQRRAALDMSQAARMKRAREMGFDTSHPVYHGAPDARGIEEGFKTLKERYGMEEPERAFFFTEDRRVAQTYANPHRAFDYQGSEPKVIAAYLKMTNPMTIDWGGKKWSGTEKAIADARAAGHDGIIIRNVIDDYQGERKKPTTVRVVFNPEQIRSVDAAFDPAETASPNILYRRPGEPARWFTRAVMPDGSVRDKSFEARSQADAERMAREAAPEASRVAARAIPEDTSPEAVRQKIRDIGKAIEDSLGAIVGKTTGNRARMILRSQIMSHDGMPVLGRYAKGLIEVALSENGGKLIDMRFLKFTTRHEVFHFMREVGAIGRDEWRVLEKRAKQWRKDFDTDARYVGATETELNEEAMADAYGAWGDGSLPKQAELAVRGVFNRIKQILAAVRDAIKKLFGQHATAEDVFAALEAGQFAEKGGVPGGVRSKDMLPAWHGSPHDFEAFDSGKIGTAEGNQAYGHGLYFASRKEIAEHYRAALSSERFMPHPPGLEETLKWVEGGMKGKPPNKFSEQTIEDAYNEIDFEGRERSQEELVKELRDWLNFKPGKLYQVELAPDDDQLLDWDKPLSEQSAGVREKLKKIAQDVGVPQLARAFSGREFYSGLGGILAERSATATTPRGVPGDVAASAALRDAGIPGIRYLDGSSRTG